MKKKTFIIALFVAILVSATPLFADRNQALSALQNYLDQAKDAGYRLGDGSEGSSWWVWYMNPGYFNQVDRTFYSGNTYLLVAAGDDGVSDVDIKVYDEDWNLIDSDEDNSSLAVAKFSPRWDGLFHVKVIYYSGHTNSAVGFFVSYR